MEIHLDDEEAKRIRKRWFWLLAGIWWVIILIVGGIRYASVANDYKNSHGAAAVGNYFMQGFLLFDIPFLGMIGTLVMHFVSKPVARAHMKHREERGRIARARENERAQRAFKNQVESFDKESKTAENLKKATNSKRALIMHLANIDQFILALAGETNDSNRTMTMQAAQKQIATLADRLASGEISRAMIDDPEIREQASETSKDLARLGLSEDRLNRDLIRMFKLNSE